MQSEIRRTKNELYNTTLLCIFKHIFIVLIIILQLCIIAKVAKRTVRVITSVV